MTENSLHARPRTTVGQWLTLAAVVAIGIGILIAVSIGVAFAGAYLTAFGNGLDELSKEQVTKEAVCIPYTNGVLELAERGYSAAEITAAYEAAAVPVDEETGEALPDERDQDQPASWAVHYCGDPADIMKTTAAAGR